MRAEHVPDPPIEHPGDAIMRITRSCICGSHLHLWVNVVEGLLDDARKSRRVQALAVVGVGVLPGAWLLRRR